MANSEKTYERTDGRTLFCRNLPAEAGGPKRVYKFPYFLPCRKFIFKVSALTDNVISIKNPQSVFICSKSIIGTLYETCSKLIIKATERHHWPISHFGLVFPLLTLNKKRRLGQNNFQLIIPQKILSRLHPGDAFIALEALLKGHRFGAFRVGLECIWINLMFSL